MADDQLVIVEDLGAYARIRLNRPAQRNAMNSAARQALQSALHELRGAHRVVVVTGVGNSFCSGVDLKEATAAPPSQREAGAREWIDTLLAIRRHPAIFIAAVNGFALGGGASLINACELALAAHEAEIGMPEVTFGVYPAMAGPATQMNLLPKHAAWMVLTGERIDGRMAAQWGMVNRSVPIAELDDAADALARRIAAFDAATLEGCKHALETVPRRISEWPSACDYGLQVNAGIQARRVAQAASAPVVPSADKDEQ
jgi:enoyl-CoA hydratase/carnithine racemase